MERIAKRVHGIFVAVANKHMFKLSEGTSVEHSTLYYNMLSVGSDIFPFLSQVYVISGDLWPP